MWQLLQNNSSVEIPQTRHTHARVDNFMEVICSYSDVQYRSHFRLRRETVSILVAEYDADETKRSMTNLSGELAVHLTLWYLANTEPFRAVSDRFGLDIVNSYYGIMDGTRWLCIKSPEFIQWPTDAEKETIAATFGNKGPFYDVIGLIDCCHIKIRCPIESKIDFYNRKKFYSIHLQAIVDDQFRFRDVHVGEPGSMHDSTVLQKSDFYKSVCQDNETMAKFHLLGDSAYVSTKWLISPFKNDGTLTRNHQRFNYQISKLRVRVEHAFGQMKSMWRRLHFFNNLRQDFIVHCVVACCVLHNIHIEFDRDILNENYEGRSE